MFSRKMNLQIFILTVIAQVVISANVERVENGGKLAQPENLEFVPLENRDSQRFHNPISLNAIPKGKMRIHPEIESTNEKILESPHYRFDGSSEETERFADVREIEQKLLEDPINLTDQADDLTKLETLKKRKHSEDYTKHKCMQRYDLQERNLEEGVYAKSLRQEVNKLQDLVQVLRDQQYILRILNDVDGKPYKDPKSIQHSLLKHLKKISEQDVLPKHDEVDIRDNVDEEHNQVTNLRKEVSTLKKLVTKPQKEENEKLVEQLKTQKDEIVLLKTMMSKMLKEIPKIKGRNSEGIEVENITLSTSTETTASSTVSTEKIEEVKFNSTGKLRESSQDAQNVTVVLKQLAKLQEQLTKIISTPKTPTSQEIVGAFLPPPELSIKPLNDLLASTNIFHRRNNQPPIPTKPHQIHKYPQNHPQRPINNNFHRNSTARQASDAEIDSLLNLLNDNKKSGSLEVGEGDGINKLLNSLGQSKSDSLELGEDEDIQDRLLDLQKQLKKKSKKKKKNTIEDQLKKLEKQLKNDDIQSKTLDDDDDDDDAKAQLKKLQLTIKKMNKKSKIQSKSDDDDDDVESQLRGLQKAIKGLQPKEDDDDDVEEKNANFEFMLSKLTNNHKGLHKSKLTTAQMNVIKKKLQAMKGHTHHSGSGGSSGSYSGHSNNHEDSEAKPIFSFEEIDDESGEGHGYGGSHGFGQGGQGSYSNAGGSYSNGGGSYSNSGHHYGSSPGYDHGGYGQYNYGRPSYGYSGNGGYGGQYGGLYEGHMSHPNLYGGHSGYSSNFYSPGYGPGYGNNFGSFSAILTPPAGYNPSSGSYSLPSTSYNPSSINYETSSSTGGGYSSSGGNYRPLSNTGISLTTGGYNPSSISYSKSGTSYSPPGISYSPSGTSYSPSSSSYSPSNTGYGTSSSSYTGSSKAVYGSSGNTAGTTSSGNSNTVYLPSSSNINAGGSYSQNSQGFSPNTNNIYSSSGTSNYVPSSSSSYAPNGGSTSYISSNSNSGYNTGGASSSNSVYSANSNPSSSNQGYSSSTNFGAQNPTYSAPAASPQSYGTNYAVPSQPQDSSKYISLFKQPTQYQTQQNQYIQTPPSQYPQPIVKPDMNPHQIFEHISETANDNFFPDKPTAATYSADNRQDPAQPYQDPPTNPRTEQKVSDLKNQIYELQNVIDTFNKPEYLQKPEDKETVYNLDRQIKDLKTVINNITQDYAGNQNQNGAGYQGQNYPGKNENVVQPVQYQDEKKEKNYAARFSRQIDGLDIDDDFEPETISCESNDDVIKVNDIRKGKENSEDWMRIFEEFLKEEHGGRKRSARQLNEEAGDSSAEADEAIQTLTSLFGHALLGEDSKAQDLFKMRTSHKPKLLSEVEMKVKELKQQLDRRLKPNLRQNYNQYQPVYEEEQSKELFKKPKFKLKKTDLFDKIFDKILDKLIDKAGKILPKLLEVLFGKADLKDFMSQEYGNDYGNSYGNSLEKTFRGFGLSGFLPMIALKLLSNLTYFVSYLQKYKFLKTFLVPALVLLLVAGAIIFLIWWMQPNDYGYSGHDGHSNYDHGKTYSNYGPSNSYSSYGQGNSYRNTPQYPGNSYSSNYRRNVYNQPSFMRPTNNILPYKNVNELENT